MSCRGCNSFAESVYGVGSVFFDDVGLALRPFRACRQCEFRLGSENITDIEVRNNFGIGYVAVRYIY